MSRVDFPPTPWWYVAALLVAGAFVGRLLGTRLATLGYRLDHETRPTPRTPGWAVAVLLALLWGLLAWRFGPSAEYALAPAYLGFATVAVALAWVDADVHRLPHGLTRPAYPMLIGQLALASLASGDWTAFRRALIAGAVLWAVYFVLALLAALLRSGFGLGDVTLAGLIGLATGYVSAWGPVIATYAAFLLSGVYGLGRIIARRGSRKDHIAFGPWMLVGALVALLAEVRLWP
ncbi:prepilin peptidase [Intrasporangium calvum]|uniref:Peptidase A24A prepilin type IV n=1 Tax=Intrasporangium calvum (strain ATCC 23552 / DSM 43043 / JCM 3097 / NBRC 12989 / NCIMB 10167 / NRRL B-3866 / 7 KIP) TaxID=710696 RepID=E6S8W7_INTC7|nr:A24 family peptidase [Intrasporangium calvum]ADU48104.1 peptidase A24A prepilin type IV [Intrasporangium calvum DSM 43043]